MLNNIPQAFQVLFLYPLRVFTMLGITIMVVSSFGIPKLKSIFGISFGFTHLLKIVCVNFMIISDIGTNERIAVIIPKYGHNYACWYTPKGLDIY